MTGKASGTKMPGRVWARIEGDAERARLTFTVADPSDPTMAEYVRADLLTAAEEARDEATGMLKAAQRCVGTCGLPFPHNGNAQHARNLTREIDAFLAREALRAPQATEEGR